MPERDLLREWQAAMQSVVRAVAGGGDVARQVMAPLQRQTELFQEVLEAERRLQREVVGRALAPLDAAFDLLEQTAVLMKTQAELFERTIKALREPSRIIGSAAWVERRGRRS